MMPGTAEDVVEEEFPEPHINYKQKYKTLKKKLRLLVYEQECFLDELRKAQRKLLKVSRDRSFLLDRLLQQEKFEDSSEESDATNSTDTEEGAHHREAGPAKKRKLNHAQSAGDASHPAQNSSKHSTGSTEVHGSKKKNKGSNKKSSKANTSKASAIKQESPGHMTREEIERHLDSKHNEFGIEKATASLPMEIFSNDPNHDSDGGAEGGGEEEEDDLVIDVPH